MHSIYHGPKPAVQTLKQKLLEIANFGATHAHSDVRLLMAPLSDALRQRHGLRGRQLLGTLDCALRITASALEGASLEVGALGIQKASHSLAKALGLGALARVFAG